MISPQLAKDRGPTALQNTRHLVDRDFCVPPAFYLTVFCDTQLLVTRSHSDASRQINDSFLTRAAVGGSARRGLHRARERYRGGRSTRSHQLPSRRRQVLWNYEKQGYFWVYHRWPNARLPRNGPNSRYSNGPGKVGFGAVVGGRHIETGDMFVADRDGVVVVPFAVIDAVIAQLAAIQELEDTLDEKV